METTARKQSGATATERVFEALATVAALLDRTLTEMKAVDAEFQERLLKAVHDTEASLQTQASQHLQAASAEWDLECRTLKAEVERLKSALLAAAQAEPAKKAEPAVAAAAVASEIERVQALVKEISASIANPGTPMSTVMRKSVERAELEGYLKGIRYAAPAG
jgi:hypothetical protein